VPSYSSVCPRGESPDPKIKPASWVAFVAPPNLDLALLVTPPDAQVPPAILLIVSLKAFVVELKNNCPSTC
jgi:hypothetical protein